MPFCIVLRRDVSDINDTIKQIQCNTVNPTTVDTTTRMIRHSIFGPANLLSIPCNLPRLIRHFTTVNPTTRMIRHFLTVPIAFLPRLIRHFLTSKRKSWKVVIDSKWFENFVPFSFVFIGHVFIMIPNSNFSTKHGKNIEQHCRKLSNIGSTVLNFEKKYKKMSD